MPEKRNRRQGNKQGSYWLLKDGRYRWSITVGTSAEGKQQRRTGTAINITEAKKALARALTDHERGLLGGPERVTVGQWLAQWLALKRNQVGPTTFEQYEMYLRLYVTPCFKAMRLRDVKPSHVRHLDSELLGRKRPLASATRGKVLSHLRAAFEMAVEEGLMPTNPARNVRIKATSQEEQTRRRKAMDDDELRRFMEAAAKVPQHALLYTLFSLGLRRGEALGLQWRDIDLEAGTVRVERQLKLLGNVPVEGVLKTQSSRRVLYIADDLRAVLLNHRAQEKAKALDLGMAWHEQNYVFTSEVATPLHPRNVNRIITGVCREANVPRFSSHSGRHTNITQRLKAGQQLEVVAAIAGHKDINTTLSHYREVLEQEKRAATFNLGTHLIRPAKMDADRVHEEV
ncbi:hypothetical protein DEIPH_ctg103orf0040 [Deinococcus phoenicis]|uniref:Phage integrase n=1 Tax=Deinococcus phoenicis TaxID=1476583 RepID=A0A016QKK8_9DEIO|nr:site-specific integrase [Deinococcus phoenicis]EYB66511.1 hypothetical protein DEIPH_ctg103orf0040 [Deinococcus phoenicis]